MFESHQKNIQKEPKKDQNDLLKAKNDKEKSQKTKKVMKQKISV